MSVLPHVSTEELAISAFPEGGRIYAAYKLLDEPHISIVEIIDKEITITINYSVELIGSAHIHMRRLSPTITYEKLLQEIESLLIEKHL